MSHLLLTLLRGIMEHDDYFNKLKYILKYIFVFLQCRSKKKNEKIKASLKYLMRLC